MTVPTALYAAGKEYCYYMIHQEPSGGEVIGQARRGGGHFSHDEHVAFEQAGLQVETTGSDQWVFHQETSLVFTPIEATRAWMDAVSDRILYPYSSFKRNSREVKRCKAWMQDNVYSLMMDFGPELLQANGEFDLNSVGNRCLGRDLDFDAFTFSPDLKAIKLERWEKGSHSCTIKSNKARFGHGWALIRLQEMSQFPLEDSKLTPSSLRDPLDHYLSFSPSSMGPNLSSLTHVLEATPAAFALCIFAIDICRLVPFLSHVFAFLSKPFQPFLEEHDLLDYEKKQGVSKLGRWKWIVLVVLASLQAALWTGLAAFDAISGRPSLESAGLTVSWVYLAGRTAIRPTLTPPYALICFSVLLAGMGAFSSNYNGGHNTWASVLQTVGCLFIIGISSRFHLHGHLSNSRVAKPGTVPTSTQTSPEDKVTLSNWFTFSWVQPIMDLAGTQTLDDENVWQLSPYFKHRNLFTKYLSASSDKPSQSLLRFLLSWNSLDLIISFSLQLYKAIAGFIQPYCLQQILRALESRDPTKRSDAYFYAGVLFVAHCSFAQVDVWEAWHSRRAYERTRGIMFCGLHWKALKRRDMSGKTKEQDGDTLKTEDEQQGPSDIGRVANLMTGDAYAVAQRFWEFPAVFVAPVRMVIALIFLYRILGWSCFTGISVVLLAYAVNYPLAMLNLRLMKKSWASKDLRMSYVNEFIQSIRFLKYMGWESQWAERVRTTREVELGIRVKQNTVDVIISFIWGDFSYPGEYVQGPLTQLPGQIIALLQAFVSMKRIEDFLSEDEVEDWASSLKRHASQQDRTSHVGFESASFQWHGSHTAPETSAPPSASTSDASGRSTPATRFSLHDITATFPTGKLSLITGATGSGKSSLLNALLGEMYCTSGRVHLDKSHHAVAYAAQLPWLQHATIRDNIVFRSPFDPARYDMVLECCALKPDLKVFEAGDMTEIGEKGVSLSGGQRARVALARAIYSRATVVILDDPLAAVDMHTARHLLQTCFLGPIMKDRTIILVTHHVSLCLPAAAYIIEMGGGTVIRQGTVQELQGQGQLNQVLAEEDVTEDIAEEEEPALLANEADVVATEQVAAPNKLKPSGKLIEAEHRAEGRVTLATYLTYIQACGWVPWTLIVFLILAGRGIQVGNQFFLARWSQAYSMSANSSTTIYGQHIILLAAPSIYQVAPIQLIDLPPPAVNVLPWLIIFSLISLASALATLAFLSVGYWGSINASRTLFSAMLNRVSRAPSSFFDKTPVGRILNRFTADINAVDGTLMNSTRNAMTGTVSFLASFGVICLVVPRFAPLALAIASVYIMLAPPYVKASRDLRRLESIFLSPAFSGFDELLYGLIHVRAFGMEMQFQERFYGIVDKFQGFDHFYWMVSYWMKERYDYLGSVIVFATTLFALWTHVSEGMAALVIVNAGVFAQASRDLVKVFAQLELDFNSVERIGEYLDVEQEAAAVSVKRPPAYWPSSNGGISVEDLVITYSKSLPPVLKGISFEVKPREKVGVVGRTGSGKSTLAMSLLRIVEATSGRIILDGIDVATIGLDDLRGNITIVSQDVALFSGTVRSNLDPFNEHTDEECWDVLARCHLVHPASGVEDTDMSARKAAIFSLSQAVSASGSSFSAGERQLLALARAMLRNAHFTILDEASSSIDLETDDKIQRTIREEMVDSLVITIAHRLKTVIGKWLYYDRILVLDEGKIAEFDTPSALLSHEEGIFRKMCEQSADWEEIQSMLAEK
ncbi:hypothetical protein FRB98_008435 [Tulasnella sp. 332]|nr:hypothetical protein FRB98_008435 [Tulasnella sp. 332]